MFSEPIHNTIVLVWVFSSVLAWASVSSMTSMGLTLPSDSFRKGVREAAFWIGLVSISTSGYVLPKLLGVAVPRISFADAFGMTAFTAILWAAIHVGGAVFTVFRYFALKQQNAL